MFRVVVIGDKFIPATTYLEQWETKSATDPVLRDVELVPIEWNLEKAEQHRLQQVMEWDGANAVEPPPEILQAVSDADAIVMHFAPVGRAVIEAAPRLKLIAVARAGLENVDQVAAKEHSVFVTGVTGRNAAAVAELAIGLMLAECRNIARADHSIKSGGWRKTFEPAMVELGESTIGIVGWGHVARHLGHKLTGLANRLIVHDPYANPEDIRAAGAEVVGFDEVFERADFVHVMARLTPETERFIGAAQFAMMKPTAYFINTARSRLVDYDALYAALAARQIAGAGLDVFDDEPLAADSPWRELDNVTMTTHYGGDTTGTNNTSARLVLEAIAEFLHTTEK
jgi:D-3-phosphoglycerate dehydrogenase